jgi:hypothetical protein
MPAPATTLFLFFFFFHSMAHEDAHKRPVRYANHNCPGYTFYALSSETLVHFGTYTISFSEATHARQLQPWLSPRHRLFQYLPPPLWYATQLAPAATPPTCCPPLPASILPAWAQTGSGSCLTTPDDTCQPASVFPVLSVKFSSRP